MGYYFSTTKAGKKIDASGKTVRALIKAGKIPAIDISTVPGKHRFRIDPEDLQRFIDEAKFSPVPTVRKRRKRQLAPVKEFV